MHDPLLAPASRVAAAFKNRDAAGTALRDLLDSGIATSQIGVGAIGAHRAEADELAAQFAVRSDVDGEDPLAGAPGLASAAQAAGSVNRGALIGGALGALVGAALGFYHGLPVVVIDPQLRALSLVLLFFVLGALAGATLGGAFAPQRSTHAAFRIVDEIEHGGIAVVVTTDRAAADMVESALAKTGGMHVLRVPSEERTG